MLRSMFMKTMNSLDVAYAAYDDDDFAYARLLRAEDAYDRAKAAYDHARTGILGVAALDRARAKFRATGAALDAIAAAR